MKPLIAIPLIQERTKEPAAICSVTLNRTPFQNPFPFIVLERLNAAEMSVT
jgi:hypothetical protein